MNRIFIQGDVHGKPIDELSFKKHKELRETDREDVVIFLGDFGIPFGVKHPAYEKQYYKEDRYQARWLNAQPYTSLVLLGNHDDRDAISEMPMVEKFSTQMRQLSFGGETYENIFIIDKPQVLNICGKKCLIIGGAKSHDIAAGILDSNENDFKDKLKYRRKAGIHTRVNHWSWWENEDVDIKATLDLLSNHKNDYFDLILTHDCPTEFFTATAFYDAAPTDAEKLFSMIVIDYNFKNWYHGHMHEDIDYGIDKKIHCCYHVLREI